MPRDEVQEHPDPLFVRAGEQADQVLIRSVARGDAAVVAHVVAGVFERRVEAGIDPQGVAAEVPDIIQLLDDPVQVADPVAVGIEKGLRVDLIKYGVVDPARHGDGLL